MTPVEIIALTELLLTGIEKLAPRIAELVQKGEISKTQQMALLNRIETIQSGAAFSGDHWRPSDSTVTD